MRNFIKVIAFFISILILFLHAVHAHEIVFLSKLENSGEKDDLSTRVNGKKHVDEVLYKLKRKHGEMLLDLKRSIGFHSEKILLRTFNGKNEEKIENHVPDSCYYSGKVVDVKDSHVLLNTCNGIRGIIETGEKVYNIEPINGRESRGAHKMFEPEEEDYELSKNTIGIDPSVEDYINVPSKRTTEDHKSKALEDAIGSTTNEQIIPEIDSQYAAYAITKTTKYVEMFLVVDNAIYLKYGRDKKLVTKKMLNMIHAVDRAYAAVNIRVVLTAIEIWTDGNKMPYISNGVDQMSAFRQYRQQKLLPLLPHDIAHYISEKSWTDGVVGMGYLGGICKPDYGAGMGRWSFESTTGSSGIMIHELGHNFGFPHDESSCVCMTSRGCSMGGERSRRPGFSDCNMKVLSDPNNAYECLNNYPKGVIGSLCGNGIIEGSEECDCGSPERCKKLDSCCEPFGCKLKRSSQCSDTNNPQCCKNCLFKKQGTLCREARNVCDLPEYCTGSVATCPDDVFAQDGTTCSDHISVIPGNTNAYSVQHVKLNPSIKARFIKINPIYKPNGQACMRLEALTCSADEAVSNHAQPIATIDLHYTSSLCVVPTTTTCEESIATDAGLIYKKEQYGDCNKKNFLFVLESDGTLRHQCSGKIVCPDSSNNLYLKKECPDNKGKYERLQNFGLKNKGNGGCVESEHFWPDNGRHLLLRWTTNCDGDRGRSKLRFLETDCLLPIGMENGKLPDSAFTASAYYKDYLPSKARVESGKGWCLPKTTGKDGWLKIDLGQIKTISAFKSQGDNWDYVSGFKLFYSDDGKSWEGYSSNDDADKNYQSVCYQGGCSISVNMQCRDLWDSGAKSAQDSCWKKLNMEATGFGTCNSTANVSCALENIHCGQLQCSSGQAEPSHIKYGSMYKAITVDEAKCSAASITIPPSTANDLFGTGAGMVREGTKCGEGKMCSKNKCQSVHDVNHTPCRKVNGAICAGKGVCDNNGICHCNSGFDPFTYCETAIEAVNGNWGQWTTWSSCTAACNGGTRKRSRFCDSPFAAHGGSPCEGTGYEESPCNSDACPKAKSCKSLMIKLREMHKPLIDGVYDRKMADGSVKKMYCDMSRDGGGWTLVVSSHKNDWTTSDMVRERNVDKPSLWKDYSNLKYVDQIKENYKIEDDFFEYRLEAHARGRWGGIWSAPSYYKIDTVSPHQNNVKLIKKFDAWNYSSSGIAQRMPHVVQNSLTMQKKANSWGSITGNAKSYHPAAWIDGPQMESTPEHIWYWLREGRYKLPRSCMEIKLRILKQGSTAKSGQYEIQSQNGTMLTTYCDMKSYGGGWTLVLNRASTFGWTADTTLSKNAQEVSKLHDYSILFHSEEILDLRKEESTFQYMIEAGGDKRWGGIFEGEIRDGLIGCKPSKKRPKLLKKFDGWNETKSSLVASNPYMPSGEEAYLTTAREPSKSKDGVLIPKTDSKFIKEKPQLLRIWVRESASHRSCNQIKVAGTRRGMIYKDGFYIMRKSDHGPDIRTIYCDMTSDAGAWTLLVTSAHGNWSKDQVLSRNEDHPSLFQDYSILHIADSIKNMSNKATFKYRLDANIPRRWGGIWEAPKEYTFTHKNGDQENVKLLKQFDKWDYNVWYKSVNKRMPWLGAKKGLLTTSGTSDYYWFGTIISETDEYAPAPWISSEMTNPAVIWYWVNEDDCDADRHPINGRFTEWSTWTACSCYCGPGTMVRYRTCTAPKPRCGGAPCNSKQSTKEVKKCQGPCVGSPIRSYDAKFCVLPGSGGCSPDDETVLKWRGGSEACSSPEAQFVFDVDHGTIIHKCSGKSVCPAGGSDAYGTRIVISSKCPANAVTQGFRRTIYDTLATSDKCIHPVNGKPADGVDLNLWSGCDSAKLKTVFSKIENGRVHTKFWGSVASVHKNISDLINDVRFPNNPTSTGFLDNMDSPYLLGEHYGILLWSHFAAPETGMYTFYAACDDYCQVFLSTSDQEKDKKKIIDVKGWTKQYKYDQRSDQKSKLIYLESRKVYYLEAFVAEVTGSDHLSVAVDLPSGRSLKPIQSYYLRSKAEY